MRNFRLYVVNIVKNMQFFFEYHRVRNSIYVVPLDWLDMLQCTPKWIVEIRIGCANYTTSQKSENIFIFQVSRQHAWKMVTTKHKEHKKLIFTKVSGMKIDRIKNKYMLRDTSGNHFESDTTAFRHPDSCRNKKQKMSCLFHERA